jgi:preprotein translocase subunit SecG
MVIFLTIVHIILCIFLVIVVLLQSGKAADLAGAFGGMGSQTAFGPRGSATVLSKATTIAAALFMVTSLTLAIYASRGVGVTSSVTESQKGAASKTQAPAAPAGPANAPAQQGTQPAAPAPGAQPAKPPTVTVTPIGPGGQKGPSQTTTVPVQPAPAPPKK